MTNEYTPRNQDLARLKRLDDEATRLKLKPVERNIFVSGAPLVDSGEGIRVYDRRKKEAYHSVLISIVYDDILDKETASHIGNLAAGTPGFITVFYATAKGAVRGLVPKDDYYEQISNGQISVDIEGDGELVERAVKEVKSILEKARQRTLTPAPRTC